MARPRGEYREKLGEAADALLRDRGCFNGRDVAHLAAVRFEVGRRTLADMARAGELVVIGRERVDGVCRPMNLYARPVASSASVGADLGTVVRCWADFQ